jgi:hypothetical protein
VKRLARLSVAGGAVVGLCGLVLVPPAGAATLGGRGAAHGVPEINYSGTAAGYISAGSTQLNHFQGTTEVPALNCSAASGNPATAAMNQSLQLWDDGTEAGSGIFVYDDCNSGEASYQLWTFVATGPTSDTFEPTGITVSPGDRVGALMTVSSTGTLTVSVKDVTTTSSVFTQSGPGATAGAYNAFAYIQNDLPAEPIPTFGTALTGPGSGAVEWNELKLDGRPISETHASAYNMVNPANNDPMIDTSPIGAKGTDFSNTFVANQ